MDLGHDIVNNVVEGIVEDITSLERAELDLDVHKREN